MLRLKETVYRATVESPRGPAHIMATEKGLCAVALPGRDGWLDRWVRTAIPGADVVEGHTGSPHIAVTSAQLAAYFTGGLHTFDLPLDMRGTALQRAVWQEVRNIPYGDTRPFSAVAGALGLSAARAVGGANQANPLAVIVPTHRVVDQSAEVKPHGATAEIQRWLLAHEGLMPAAGELPAVWYRRKQRSSGPLYIGTPRAGTYCLPACLHVQGPINWVPRLFRSTTEAKAAGFRPCRSCGPDEVLRSMPLPA